MAGQPCDVCYRWVVEPIGKHNARHIADNPHTFCRTIRCGDDCPVPQIDTTQYGPQEDAVYEQSTRKAVTA